jgi:kynureninase
LFGRKTRAFRIITPSDVERRGTQLNILLKPGRLEALSELSEEGIVADKRKLEVIRMAPVPLYNTYEEIWRFVEIFKRDLKKCD